MADGTPPPAPDGPDLVGPVSDDPEPDGAGPELDGPGPDGSGPDGSDADAPGPAGPEPDGAGPDGAEPDGPGPDGSGPDGSGPDGSGPDGSGVGGRAEPVGFASAVRPFLLTAGRVAADAEGRAMPVETQVVATTEGIDSLDRLVFEQHDIVAVCRLPQSIAEIAARLRLHLNVVRVLAEDLRAAGQLTVHVPDSGVVHDASVLRRVIAGLRAIPDSRGVTP